MGNNTIFNFVAFQSLIREIFMHRILFFYPSLIIIFLRIKKRNGLVRSYKLCACRKIFFVYSLSKKLESRKFRLMFRETVKVSSIIVVFFLVILILPGVAEASQYVGFTLLWFSRFDVLLVFMVIVQVA